MTVVVERLRKNEIKTAENSRFKEGKKSNCIHVLKVENYCSISTNCGNLFVSGISYVCLKANRGILYCLKLKNDYMYTPRQHYS